jgi:hypothetical protein
MSILTPHIKAWKWAVTGQPNGQWPEVVETHSEKEYLDFAVEISAAANAAKTAGHQTHIGGSQNPSGGKKMWLTANGKRLTVAYVPKPRAQAVTETSRESYRKVNLGQKCEEVAKAAMSVQSTIGYATDGAVARFLGCSSALVSARRNDIENAGGIDIENSQYRIAGAGTIQDLQTNRRVNAWKVVAVPKSAAVQTELFS